MAESRSRLSMEKREELTRIFLCLDTDGNGWLSREEVGAWLRGAGYSGLTDQQIEKVFRVIDANADGKITLDEFYNAVELIQRPPDTQMTYMQKVFQAMDTNGDGQLSEDELLQGLRKCGYNLTRQQVKKLVTNLDKDGDGHISFEEFISAFQ